MSVSKWRSQSVFLVLVGSIAKDPSALWTNHRRPMAAEIFSRPPVFHFCVSDVDRCDGLPVLLSGASGTAIVIAESNKEGFQYLQTGFYSSSSNDYCWLPAPKRKNLGIRVEEKEIATINLNQDHREHPNNPNPPDQLWNELQKIHYWYFTG